MKKTKKDEKIVLTKGKKRGIIWELSGRGWESERSGRGSAGKGAKKSPKKFEKRLDKRDAMWYNNQVAAKRRQRLAETIGHRSLKIEQQSRENLLERSTKQTQKCEVELEQIPKRKHKQSKSKRAKKKLEDDCSAWESEIIQNIREFDPGSGWTLAACITHSSRTDWIGSNTDESQWRTGE